MVKQRIVVIYMGVCLGLSGCMYSNNLAPVYSISSKNTPAVSTKGKNNIPNNNSVGSIEQPGNQAMVVSNSQANPYGTPSATINNGITNNGAVRPGSSDISAPSNQMSDSAIAAASDDPRIKDANQVLSDTQKVGQQAFNSVNQAARPSIPATQNNTQAVAAASSSAQQAASQATQRPSSAAAPQSATKTLLQEARTSVAAGNYDKAASALERAHRIEPSNAKILYDISQIRYAQGKYRQAESFASKAANYTKSPELSKKIWTILANSRKALGNSTGAAAAANKAANF